MSIEVCNESGIALDESLVASVARHALDAMHVNPAAELSILAVTSEVMAELHERWMDEPGPTDVMSFPMDELVEESRRPDASTMGPALLGDIVLCPDFAKAQARAAGHTLADELHLLTVHGVLHLLGGWSPRSSTRTRNTTPSRKSSPVNPSTPFPAGPPAVAAGHSSADELHLLTVHGALHLLGYDHAEPEEEREMVSLQNRLLQAWRAGRQAG